MSVNLTVVAPAGEGYLVAFPAGEPVPDSSTVNFGAGRTRANTAILTLGTAGALTLQTNASADVIVDVNGWFE